MARRNETVWCGMFDDLYAGGLSSGTIKLEGAPIYVFQVRAQPPQRWVAKILRRNVEPWLMGDCAEAVKFAVEKLCRTKVTDWVEGYWDDDVWMPKTSRPAVVCAFKGPPYEPLPTETTRRGRPRKGAKV